MRLFVIDDFEPFRAALRTAFSDSEFETVGEAGGVEEAIDTVVTAEPEVVIVDVNLGDGDGFDLAETLRLLVPEASIVMTSSRPRSDYAWRLESDAVTGFVPKDELTPESLAAALPRSA